MIDLDRLTRVLSPKQIRSIAGAQKTPQIALWSGAVSSGKTFASLLAFLIVLSGTSNRGLVVIVGKTLQTIERNVIVPLQSPYLFGPFARHVHHTPGSNTAVILGRTVWLIGANDTRAEDRIRGVTVELAYVDEASLVPQGFWMMLVSRLRVVGAKLLATTNPDAPGHWLRQDFLLRGLDIGLVHWHFTLDDNPSLDPAYVERLKKQYVGLWYRRFIAGEWCLAEGAVYEMFDERRHVVDELPQINRWIAAGIDYGTVNPFAALTLGVGVDGVLYVTHEWYWDSRRQRRQLTDDDYSKRLRSWLAEIEVHPQYVVVDPSAASFVTQLWRDGMTPVLGDNAVLDGIRTVSSLLGQDLLKIHRRCVNLRDQVPGYSWDPDAAKRGEDKPIKDDDHCPDAWRYGVHTTESAWRHQVGLKEAA